jgi:membrane-bound serine protease (ClpP class)
MVVAGFLALVVVSALSNDASAIDGCDDVGCIDVVAVDGLIDEIEASSITDTLRAADAAGNVEAVVLQMDSEGAAVDDRRLEEVARAMRDAEVPVTVWIGPSGAVALGGAAELVAVADFASIAPGAEVGAVGSQRLSRRVFGDLFPGEASAALSGRLEGEEAVDAGVVERFAPIVRDHIVNIEGVEVETDEVDGEQRLSPVALVRFSKLPLGTQFLHTVASPSVAYLLLAVAAGLLVFEFYTAGVGIAGVVGAGCLLLAGYGIAALPHNNWAVGLVVLSAVAFAVDVQTGVPRAWTWIAMVLFAVGSVFLLSEFRPTWLALVVGIAGMAVAMFSGMPAMVRSRFGTPTIGREWMVGETGLAATSVDPEGTVRVRGALWLALTNRATPISQGETVRVTGIDGLALEVEPESGGAVDYRELRSRK